MVPSGWTEVLRPIRSSPREKKAFASPTAFSVDFASLELPEAFVGVAFAMLGEIAASALASDTNEIDLRFMATSDCSQTRYHASLPLSIGIQHRPKSKP
jgi:hypothetical protein